ncbi:hypothetical protein C8F04DRAFT_1266465 [Mycena alexandri]|uniref:Ubiquitin-like domain-containing protein n=1 Tax=Mycena alexandri TaxID=1745969 RepID=A0AAD6SI08_9AGAR|nr:hypothetical protein C8F04DRAFT_1266465 [Mycena alexandri]
MDSVENSLKFSLLRCHLKKVVSTTPGPSLLQKDEIILLKRQLMDQKAMISMVLALFAPVIKPTYTTLERVEKPTNQQQVALVAMQCSIQQLPPKLTVTILRLAAVELKNRRWESGGNTHKVIWFVDAVGNKLPIPIEFCINRATLEGLLRVYFKDRAGNRYIEDGRCELAEEINDQVTGIKDWAVNIRPGMTLTTRMIYVSWNEHPGEVCASCRRTVPIQDSSGFTCAFCGTMTPNSGAPMCASPEPPPDEQFIRRFLVRKTGARSAYLPGQRVSSWDALGNVVYAIVQRFELERTTVYKVHRESDGKEMRLP